MNNNFIPVNTPLLNGNEKKYLSECIDTAWISSEGPFVRKLENSFAQYTHRQHGIAVMNGSVALDLAFQSLNLNANDEVILPSFTIISCAAAIFRTGAKLVTVDCDPFTWNMTAKEVEKKITPKTKAILIVHLYGLPVDMDPILRIAKERNLWVIEDAAEMHGQSYNGRPCGSFGDISIFSFYPNKLITSGEGGLIVTNNDEIASFCRSKRNLSFGTGENRFKHEELGWNYRMSNLQAAVAVAQFERLSSSVARKREIGSLYNKLLGDIPEIQLPVQNTEYAKNIYWIYGIVINSKKSINASTIMNVLLSKGIESRPFFWPIHEQPVFLKMGLFKDIQHPIAENIAKNGFYIPSGLGITNAQIETVSNAIHEIFL